MKALKANASLWTIERAGDILTDWQRAFSKAIYNNINNTDGIDDHQFHPLVRGVPVPCAVGTAMRRLLQLCA